MTLRIEQHLPAVSSLGACSTPALTPQRACQHLRSRADIEQPLTAVAHRGATRAVDPDAVPHQCPQYGSPTRAAGFDSEETAILIQTGLSKSREWSLKSNRYLTTYLSWLSRSSH
jgi:hypothetical protein